MRTLVRTAGWQNLTEAGLSPKLRSCDLIGVSEAERSKLTKRQEPDLARYFPQRDKKQAILWNPDKIHVVRKGFIVFHHSGEYESDNSSLRVDWDHIHTPLRGLAWLVFQLPKSDQLYGFGEMHWLNSWKPLPRGIDRWTDDRRRIVEETTIPKVLQFVDRLHDAHIPLMLGGDTNSIPWNGALGHDLRQVKSKGLDRAWVTDCKQITDVKISEGPKVGVGNQLKHHGVILKARLAA